MNRTRYALVPTAAAAVALTATAYVQAQPSPPASGASVPPQTPDVRIIEPTWFVLIIAVVVALAVGYFVGRSSAGNRVAQ
jgi:hypothetical protein